MVSSSSEITLQINSIPAPYNLRQLHDYLLGQMGETAETPVLSY
jgi:hypothetical protein